jgi:hypothetical protein
VKILNLNLHFYPHSLGGASVVAEKLALGLRRQGHDVFNIYLTISSGEEDFSVSTNVFGTSIGINHIYPDPSTKYSNQSPASLILELIKQIGPDRIIFHASQGLGVLEILADQAILERSIIVLHDQFWGCLQGFRSHPSGKPCKRTANSENCSNCSWFPGLVDVTYSRLREILENVRAVSAPSNFLRDSYELSYPGIENKIQIVSNPDAAEWLTAPTFTLGKKNEGITRCAYFGGPGNTKGWDAVQKLMELHHGDSSVEFLLLDAGKFLNQPWYEKKEWWTQTHILEPFHWTAAGHVLDNIDIILSPSHVEESYGLSAREILAVGGSSVIRPSGALAELLEFQNIVEYREGLKIPEYLNLAMETVNKKAYANKTISTYTNEILNLC